MNKGELAAAIAEKSGLTKKDALAAVDAFVEAVEEAAEKAGFSPDHIEGHKNGNWTLLDYKGVVIHIFDEDARSFYDLDRIWKDGTPVDADELKKEFFA